MLTDGVANVGIGKEKGLVNAARTDSREASNARESQPSATFAMLASNAFAKEVEKSMSQVDGTVRNHFFLLL